MKEYNLSNEFEEGNYSSKMDKSIGSFKKDISTLRTGRANTSMLDIIKVDVYGQLMPIEQLATVSVPEARLISIQVWDKSNISHIDNAIQKSELGINPQIDGQIIRLRKNGSSSWAASQYSQVMNSDENRMRHHQAHLYATLNLVAGDTIELMCWGRVLNNSLYISNDASGVKSNFLSGYKLIL